MEFKITWSIRNIPLVEVQCRCEAEGLYLDTVQEEVVLLEIEDGLEMYV